jgi:transcriptional regulator with XRE-family HTH domain
MMKKAKRRSTSPKTSNSIDKFIGKRMCELRRMRNLRQSDLGRLLGVSFQQIQKYENGTNRVSAARLFNVCKALKVPLASMFERDPTA